MESSDFVYALKGAFKYGTIALGLFGIYFFSEKFANAYRSMQNPPSGEKIWMMVKGAGVLILVALFFGAEKGDEESTGELNKKRSTLVFFTTLPAMILGMNQGFSRKKQDAEPPPTGDDVM